MTFLTQFPKYWDYRHFPKLLGENYFLLLNKGVSQMRIPSNEYKELCFFPEGWVNSLFLWTLNLQWKRCSVDFMDLIIWFCYQVLQPQRKVCQKNGKLPIIICVHPSCRILFCTTSSLTLAHNPYSFSVLWRATDFIIYFVYACVCACVVCVCEISLVLCLLTLKTFFPDKKYIFIRYGL